MGFLPGLLITFVTYALIGTHHIFADTVRTYTAAYRTLIYIFTRLLICR